MSDNSLLSPAAKSMQVSAECVDFFVVVSVSIYENERWSGRKKDRKEEYSAEREGRYGVEIKDKE